MFSPACAGFFLNINYREFFVNYRKFLFFFNVNFGELKTNLNEFLKKVIRFNSLQFVLIFVQKIPKILVKFLLNFW